LARTPLAASLTALSAICGGSGGGVGIGGGAGIEGAEKKHMAVALSKTGWLRMTAKIRPPMPATLFWSLLNSPHAGARSMEMAVHLLQRSNFP